VDAGLNVQEAIIILATAIQGVARATPTASAHVSLDSGGTRARMSALGVL